MVGTSSFMMSVVVTWLQHMTPWKRARAGHGHVVLALISRLLLPLAISLFIYSTDWTVETYLFFFFFLGLIQYSAFLTARRCARSCACARV